MNHTSVTDRIIAYEQDELDEDEVIDLFQHLVDTRLAWQLQGHYGRTAVTLARAGAICLGQHPLDSSCGFNHR